MADHFPLLSLDDGLLGQVLGCLPAQSVASTALSCSRLRDAARHSTAWQTACLPFLGTPQAPATAVQSAISRLGHRRVAKHLRLADAACWREVPVSGPSPPIREGCSLSTLDSGQLVVFGGHWGNDTFYNDIWMLETSASQPQWREVLVAQHPVPSPRALHFAAVMQGSVLLIHGGLLPEGYRYNDTWRIDLASDSPSWQEIGLADGGAQEAHSLLVADVSRPVPRFHHTIALVGDQLVVFGGHNYRREEMNDTWALDVGNPGKPTWRRLPGRPFQRPCKRAFQVCGVLPPASPRQHPQLVIHGGLAADEATLSDTWVLDLGTEDWRPVDVGVSSEPEERERHAACVIQPAGGRAHLLVCGGIGGSAAHTCKGLFMAQRRLLPVQPFLLSLSHWQGHRLASGQVPGIQCESGNDDGHEAAFHLGRIRAILGLQDGLEGTSSGDLETPSPHPTQYASPDEDASELVAVDGCWTGLPFAESVAVREAPAAQNGAALLQRSRSLPEPITQAGLLDPRLMRREAVCLPLRSGHVVLFGGNDGRWTDAFGDGDHRFGMADTLVMDLSPLADTAHPKSRGFRSTDDSELNDGPMAEHDHVPLATGHPIGHPM
ncbi:hypothetical protein WJX72_002670 [[Myrmecia] bisecta]|uniref:LOV domain-containing protein n=1 Tax=[Myrmecia] bisecta TaxID=41462 RepID=A0AAW1QPK1_9CHLO